MTYLRTILLSIAATLVFIGCTTVTNPDGTSPQNPTLGDAEAKALFATKQFKDILRQCRFKYGGYDLAMVVDTTQNQIEIREHQCETSLSEKFKSVRNPANPFERSISISGLVTLEITDAKTGNLIYSAKMREKDPPPRNLGYR